MSHPKIPIFFNYPEKIPMMKVTSKKYLNIFTSKKKKYDFVTPKKLKKKN